MLGQPSSVPGFEVALHRALTEPILLAGAPRSFAILNGTLAAAIGLGLRLWIAGAADLARRPRRRRVGHAQGPGLPHRPVPPRPPQGSARMLNLAEYRRKTIGLSDYLPWACLVGPGIVLNKDGSFQRTLRYRGPDLDSATEAELVSVSARLNNVLKRFGAGWALFFEAERVPANQYPGARFADAGVVAGRPGALRRLQRRRRPPREPLFPDLPLSAAARARGPRRALALRAQRREPIEARAAGPARPGSSPRPSARCRCSPAILPEAEALDDAETLAYLHGTISDKRHPVAVPADPDPSRRHAVRHAVPRRRRAEARRPAPARADRAGVSQRDHARPARCAQRSGLRLSLDHALDRARQDRGDAAPDAAAPPVVRQAQVGRRRSCAR